MKLRLARLHADALMMRRAGTYVVWAASVTASMTALYGLAESYGGWPWYVAVLFPLTVDVYWITALGVVMDAGLSAGRRLAAGIHAMIAFAMSEGGQVLYHELHAGAWHLGPMRPLAIGLIGGVPLLAAAALAHLIYLARPAHGTVAHGAVAGGMPARKAARAVPAPPRQRETVPATAPVRATTPPDGTGDRVAQAVTAPAAPLVGRAMPAPIQPGGKPDPVAVQAARDTWRADHAAGRIHSDRSLAKLVNRTFYPDGTIQVIGRTSCASIIAEERAAVLDERERPKRPA